MIYCHFLSQFKLRWKTLATTSKRAGRQAGKQEGKQEERLLSSLLLSLTKPKSAINLSTVSQPTHLLSSASLWLRSILGIRVRSINESHSSAASLPEYWSQQTSKLHLAKFRETIKAQILSRKSTALVDWFDFSRARL